MDYSSGSPGDGRTTAGWFVLGLPSLIPFALLSTMPFTMIARRGRLLISWIGMVTLFAILIGFAYVRSTPEARLATALGVDIPPDTRVVWLREMDSLNDGVTTIGACTADKTLVNALVAHHSLEEAMTGRYISRYMPEAEIPDDGMVYRNDLLKCYFDAESRTLYFVRRYFEARP